MQPSVWIVGDWEQTDFLAAVGWLQQAARCTLFDCPTAALGANRTGRNGDEPAAMLFLESRPGQFCTTDVERMHAASPLARLVALAGPWCEGPQRTSGRLQGVTRVRWSDWEVRLARELGLESQSRFPSAPLPRTVTATERIDRDVRAVSFANLKGRRVAICTSSRASFQAVADAADRMGCAAYWHSDRSAMPGCDVVIYDGWDRVCEEGELVVEAGASDLPKRVLLLSFPRPDDFARAAKLGMDAVIAQPMLLSDFATGLLGAKAGTRSRLKPATADVYNEMQPHAEAWGKNEKAG